MNKDNVSLIEKRIGLDWINDTRKDCRLFVWGVEKGEGKGSLVLGFEGLLYDIENQDVKNFSWFWYSSKLEMHSNMIWCPVTL